jgi:hypothetical protein
MNPMFLFKKLARNFDMMGIAYTTDVNTYITVGSLKISYAPANIQQPMGGVDGTNSPFLGVGIQSPGFVSVYDATPGHDTVAEVITSETDLKVLSQVILLGNSVLLSGRNAGNTADVLLARLQSNIDVLGAGQ